MAMGSTDGRLVYVSPRPTSTIGRERKTATLLSRRPLDLNLSLAVVRRDNSGVGLLTIRE